MAEEHKLGLFALALVVAVAAVIAAIGGPVWYAVGPAIVYAAYFTKLRVRGIRDKPLVVASVLAVVALAMILFAVF